MKAYITKAIPHKSSIPIGTWWYIWWCFSTDEKTVEHEASSYWVYQWVLAIYQSDKTLWRRVIVDRRDNTETNLYFLGISLYDAKLYYVTIEK